MQGRGRGAAEGEGARVNRAPRQAHSDGSLSRSSFDLAGTGPGARFRMPNFELALTPLSHEARPRGLPLDVNHPGAWGSRVGRLDLDRDQPGLGQFPSCESAGSENALAAVAGRPQLHVKTSVLVLCYSIFIAGHARYYGLSRSRAPVARSWLNDRCCVAGFLQCPGCRRRRSSAQRSLRGLDPKRLGDVRELAVLLSPFEEGIDAHIPAQPRGRTKDRFGRHRLDSRVERREPQFLEWFVSPVGHQAPGSHCGRGG